MKIGQLVDRFGSNRQNAAEPGKLLKGCSCVAIPFAGGMCEVPHIGANIVLVNDLDRHVINLCNVVRDSREWLVRRLDETPFHPSALSRSQVFCRAIENGMGAESLDWAYHYFVASWMTRGGKGGTKGEFDAGLSIRWKSGGGDSVVRFRSATEGLAEWEKVMRRCTFTTLDAFEFLGECKKRDIPENGIYADAPWPDDGDSYTQSFGIDKQRRLASVLGEFKQSRIVVRYGDHPLIRELYPELLWTWNTLNSRTQANKAKAEVLLVRKRA